MEKSLSKNLIAHLIWFKPQNQNFFEKDAPISISWKKRIATFSKKIKNSVLEHEKDKKKKNFPQQLISTQSLSLTSQFPLPCSQLASQLIKIKFYPGILFILTNIKQNLPSLLLAKFFQWQCKRPSILTLSQKRKAPSLPFPHNNTEHLTLDWTVLLMI